MAEKTEPGHGRTERVSPVPGPQSWSRLARRPAVTRRLLAFLSVAVVMACLFPGLSAQAQEPLTLPSRSALTFATDMPTSVTLPEATGGTPPYTHSLSLPSNSPLEYGLSFDPNSRILSAAVPGYDEWAGHAHCEGGAACRLATHTYRVTDDAGATAMREIEINFRDFVSDFPSGFLPTPDDLHFSPDTAITPVTLQPTADDTNYTYALTGLPPGLTFDPGTRVLSGAATEEGVTTVTYTATHDSHMPTIVHTVTFAISVAELALPTPGTLTFASGRPTTVTLPEATGGTPPYTYSLSEASNGPLRSGFSFDPGARVLSAALPGSDQWSGPVRPCPGNVPCGEGVVEYTVTDDAGTTVTRAIDYNSYDFPSGFLPAPDDLHFSPDAAITPVTLQPTADDGNYTYALTGLPPGLTFDPGARVLSGAPTEEGATTVTYTATHDSHMPTVTHTNTFAISVAELALPAPNGLAYTAGTAIDPVTLPVATGGTTPHTYALSGPNGEDLSEVPGLTFDPATRILSGTPTRAGITALSYTVTDGTATHASLTRTFDVTVTGPMFAAEVADRTYLLDEAIDPLTLPEATGAGPMTYALVGPNGADLNEAPGLTFDPATRVLSGTPTGEGAATLTYTATDDYGNATPATFAVIVVRLMFAAELEDRTYAAGKVVSLTLPEARGGAAPHAYALAGPNGAAVSEAVPGLTFDPATRILSGTPTRAGITALSYTVTDGTATPASLTRTFDVTVTGPMFAAELADRTYLLGEAIDPPTLPEATGAGPMTYALVGPNGADLSEAPGLTFDPATRVLSGTPTGEGATTLTYTATDDYGNATPATFAVIVVRLMLAAELEDRSYAAGKAVSLTLPEARGGAAPHAYALAGPNGAAVSEAVPGLTFDPDTRVLSGTPTRAGATALTYTVTDGAAMPVSLTRSFTVTVTGPMFAAEVADRTYAVDKAIDPLTLPEARGGAAPHAYVLVGPNGAAVSEAVPGLSFDPGSRVLSGIPTEEGATTLTYTATDDYGNATSATFTVTVTGLIPAALNEVLLPEVVRGMADSTVGAIARRIGQAARGAAATGLSLGGQRGWAGLRSHGEALSEGRRDFRELLAGSDFVLNAAGASSVALWGSGEYRGLSGESGTLGWDGELSGFHLGVDARPRQDLLAGVAVSWLGSDLDYEDAAAGSGLGAGAYAVELTGVHPYLGWSAPEGLKVWATAGYGVGELEVTPKGRERRSSDVETRTVGVGGSGLLLERGMSTVRLKGELMHSALEVDDSVHIEGLEVWATRVRMTVEVAQTRTLAHGGVFEPSLEVGVRHDDGDGETGSGAEVGGGLSYRDPARGITAGGRMRVLVGHGGDREEWGVQGHIRVSPGAGGQGLSLSLRPGYGDGGSGVRQLWRQGAPEDGGSRAEDYHARLEARLGYGLSLPGYTGVFTPYTGMTLGAAEGYGIGVNWKAGSRFDLDLLGERREPGAGPAEYALLFKGEVRF